MFLKSAFTARIGYYNILCILGVITNQYMYRLRAGSTVWEKFYTLFYVTRIRYTFLPSPNCCAPLQSLGRKNTHSSHTRLHAGNEVLREKEAQSWRVFLHCHHHSACSIFQRFVQGNIWQGWPRLPGRERTIFLMKSRKTGEFSIIPKRAWQLSIYKLRHRWHFALWQVDTCLPRKEQRFRPGGFGYLLTIWSRIWWFLKLIHHPYCDRLQNHWLGSRPQLQNTAFPLKKKKKTFLTWEHS